MVYYSKEHFLFCKNEQNQKGSKYMKHAKINQLEIYA